MRLNSTPWPMLALVVASLIASLPLQPAMAAVNRSFGAARVACSDDLHCVAAIPARSAAGEVTSVLQIARTPTPRSRWTVAVSTLTSLADRDRPVGLAVDGGISITLRSGSDYAPLVNIGDFYVLSQAALDRLMVDLQIGFELRFSYIDIAGTPHTDRFSLDGLPAALTDIDRIQKRVVGDRRAGAPVDLPPAPEVDAQVLVAMDGVPPRLMDWHLASSPCEAPDSPVLSSIAPVIGPLSDTAMLYAIPCHTRADRPVYRLYVIESGEIGGMDTLAFALWSKRFGWYGSDVLEGVAYDPEARRLTATDLGGGPDGCGSLGRWVWDDFAFRMEEMRAPAACGQGDPATWPAVFPPQS